MRIALAVSTVVGVGGCDAAHEAPSYRPNVVLITIDTMRADRLSPYFGIKSRILAQAARAVGWSAERGTDRWFAGQHFKAATPSIARLAGEGAVFTRAHCDVTWTTPSMASTLTGTYALKHGLRFNIDRLSPQHVTVAELLKKHDYRTAAVIGSYPLDSIYGLDQGFDVYDDEFTTPLFDRTGREASIDANHGMVGKRGRAAAFSEQAAAVAGRRVDREVTDSAADILRSAAAGGRPLFLWVHYFGPHAIEYGDLGFEENILRHTESYSEKVVTTDAEVGRLLRVLDELGLTPRTLVILHADHGESLWDHGYVGHGRYVYEDILRVPLMLRWPGVVAPGVRTRALVGNIDIAPTILEAAGVEVPGDMDGLSLLGPLLRGDGGHEELYFETYLPTHRSFAEVATLPSGGFAYVGVSRYGILRPPWKYVVTEPHPIIGADGITTSHELASSFAAVELYNVFFDRGERYDLSRLSRSLTRGIARTLSEYRSLAPPSYRLEASERHFEKLRSLGYVN